MKLGNRIVLICKKIIANFIRTDKEAVFGGGGRMYLLERSVNLDIRKILY